MTALAALVSGTGSTARRRFDHAGYDVQRQRATSGASARRTASAVAGAAETISSGTPPALSSASERHQRCGHEFRPDDPPPPAAARGRHRPAPRHRPRGNGRRELHPGADLRRQSSGGNRRLSTPRHQCPGRCRPREGQDEGIGAAFSRGDQVRDRLRHHALHPRVGVRTWSRPCSRPCSWSAWWCWPSCKTGGAC